MRPMKYEEFSKEIVKRFRKVYDWNVVVGNDKKKDIEAIQKKLCEEEVEELDVALSRQEFVKELTDCLVVLSFYEALIVTADCEKEYKQQVSDQVDKAIGMAFALQRVGFNILLAFDKVIESNYSKFDPYREDMLDKYDEHCKYLEKGGRYTNVKWERADNYVVYRSWEGKLLKGRSYQEPDLGFLEAA